MATNLREANAIVTATGILAEKKLDKSFTDNGVERITGYLTLKISDTDSLQFSVNTAAKKADGSDNQVYAGIMTVYNEYQSIVDVGEEDADWIRVSNGTIRPYFNVRRGRETITYSSNFFNRLQEKEGNEPKAEFDIELFISNIIPETHSRGDKAGEETGRAIIKGWLPTYSGIEPIELIAPEDLANDFLSSTEYVPGVTARFFGDIVNRRIEVKTEVPVKIGRPKVTITTTYTNELIVTGVEAPYDDSYKPESRFDPAAIKAGINERELNIAERKAKAEKGNQNNRGGFSGGFSPAGNTTSSRGKLPF